jgi:histidine ammonia-lyase
LRSDDGAVQRSRQVVERALEGSDAIYGVNTGFGALASKRIDDDQLGKLQRNLLLSHACGTGDPVPPRDHPPDDALKIHALGLGNSGVSLPIFRQLLKFCDLDILPFIPSRGSVGASGDLAPLAHMSLPLIGLGRCWNADLSGSEPAAETLARNGIEAGRTRRQGRHRPDQRHAIDVGLRRFRAQPGGPPDERRRHSRQHEPGGPAGFGPPL